MITIFNVKNKECQKLPGKLEYKVRSTGLTPDFSTDSLTDSWAWADVFQTFKKPQMPDQSIIPVKYFNHHW